MAGELHRDSKPHAARDSPPQNWDESNNRQGYILDTGSSPSPDCKVKDIPEQIQLLYKAVAKHQSFAAAFYNIAASGFKFSECALLPQLDNFFWKDWCKSLWITISHYLPITSSEINFIRRPILESRMNPSWVEKFHIMLDAKAKLR